MVCDECRDPGTEGITLWYDPRSHRAICWQCYEITEPEQAAAHAAVIAQRRAELGPCRTCRGTTS
jgi:hypothetical protein